MNVDDESRLRNVFWADARCRVAYEYFGEVITFDTTYLTNKYDMPFVPFVGVNHHGQSMLLGCALLSNEDTETFTWLFKTWLECMHGRSPNAITTDQDRAMKNAIEIVFPKARHRCKSDFMTRWENMIEFYKLQDNEWLKGLFVERHRWVPAYVRDTFWAGMSTTQRSESMNSFFDGYVSSKTTLKQSVEQYDNALKDKIEKENIADFRSFNTVISCISHFGFEFQFQKAFTNAKFQEFQLEIASMMHILRVLKLIGKTDFVSSNYILARWRKDIKWRYTLIKCGFDNLVGKTELQRAGKACDAFYEFASTRINSEDDLVKVMNLIQNMKIELPCNETSPRIVEEDCSAQNQATILDPKLARSKGRPPSKRKTSIVDQIVKKKLAQKKSIKNNQNSKNIRVQEEGQCSSRGQEIEHEVFYSSQLGDRIGTQESIQVNKAYTSHANQRLRLHVVQSTSNEEIIRYQIIDGTGSQDNIHEHNYVCSSENGSVNTLAPFNPNQEHFGQAPYYSQVTNYNATCSDLLQRYGVYICAQFVNIPDSQRREHGKIRRRRFTKARARKREDDDVASSLVHN
ncbi:protein FAR-RED IMPAIRED RESPONSE 1-like [Medicago truncatula]|uniref:protein FAR-RED IMPAIRED RESPONSE 1-like n=1 Tax=Medicago truncatula TaxID=3880 RepID=UPI001967C466|nr:protein FAR-RED IMPAIRED RESPONSE 1-like [Medicago truncatula]